MGRRRGRPCAGGGGPACAATEGGAGDRAHHDLAVRSALHDSGGEMRGEDRPRNEGPAQLLEHHGGRGHGQAEPPAVLGQPQREHPGVGELGPSRPVHHDVLALGSTHPVQGEPPRAQPAHPLGQRHLVLGQLEVHCP